MKTINNRDADMELLSRYGMRREAWYAWLHVALSWLAMPFGWAAGALHTGWHIGYYTATHLKPQQGETNE